MFIKARTLQYSPTQTTIAVFVVPFDVFGGSAAQRASDRTSVADSILRFARPYWFDVPVACLSLLQFVIHL